MIGYAKLRTIHLLSGVFALPALLMYGVSAVQMSHPKWFTFKPSVSEITLFASKDFTDGRLLAGELMATHGISGEISAASSSDDGATARVTVPGTIHEITYHRATRSIQVRTSVAGTIGMLNRLHHAAGLWHEYLPLRLWAVFCGLVSLATLTLGATGIWMWWGRTTERSVGLLLFSMNLIFAAAILGWLRSQGW